MPTLSCTDQSLSTGQIDRQPFKFQHTLLGHPALSLENLGAVIPRLPKDNVFYSAGLARDDDFDRAHIERKNGLTIEETLDRLRASNSYVMVRAPEQDPSFADLYRQLLADVNLLTDARGLGQCSPGSMLYLFLASPGSFTPFHFDRYSTMLFQFRGTKSVWVAPPWDERVICGPDTEAFAARSGKRPIWKEELEPLGTQFHFTPGEALHIPFVSGHYVKNGPDDVSISMSIIFNTRETTQKMNALCFNHMLRKRGLNPSRVANNGLRERAKAGAYVAMRRAVDAVRGRSGPVSIE